MAEEVHRITNAQSGLRDDLSGRQRRYFISMMIRTACFIAAVIFPSPYRWFFLLGALVLPYVSVIVANAGRETIHGKATTLQKKRKTLS